MISISFGGCVGPEMIDGPEIVELLCGCGGACVDGLEKGESVSVLMGQICCLLCLYM